MVGQPDPELDETLVPILCPRCGRNDGCTSIGREQLVCVCLWCAGENLLTVPLGPGEMKWDAIARAIEADSRRHPIHKLNPESKNPIFEILQNEISLRANSNCSAPTGKS